MPPANSIEKILENIKEGLDVEEVTLVSRSGMHIGGDVPDKAHLETFVAMSAILLGAAETATSELEEGLSHVEVELQNSKVVVLNCGPSALITLKLSKDEDTRAIIEGMSDHVKRLQDLL